MQDSIAERGKELEEAFFRKLNEKLLEQLKATKEKNLNRAGISKLTGITSEEILDQLVTLKWTPSTVAAFGLLPVVEVAWADGAVDEREKKAVLQAAHQTGVTAVGLDIITAWLNEQPPASLFTLWQKYQHAVTERMSAEDRALMKSEMLGRARAVAEASGGILGMGNKVSKAEAEVLKKIEDAFSV